MSDHEHDRDRDEEAAQVGIAVDALLEGRDSGAQGPALVAARLIRASLHPPALPTERRAALADTVAAQWAWRRRRRVLATVVAVAAALTLVVFATRWLDDDGAVPENLRSRETATLIPGPFPAEQTASDRIDLIYADRLGSFRTLELSATTPRRTRARPGQRAAAIVAAVSP